jgi:alpha-beta hydrolase superfamily lysophospholipase
MIGYSLGGLISCKMSLHREGWFNGMALLAPYMKLLNEDMVNRYLPIAKIISKVLPNMKISSMPVKDKKVKKHIMEYLSDPLMEI